MRRDPLPPLFMLWVATLGSDRVDLLGGVGPSQLMPYQLLTALLMLLTWGRHLRRGTLPALPPTLRGFAALLLVLAAFVAASLLQAVDFTLAAGRSVLFLATAVGVPLVLWGVSDREDLVSLLGRGARLGLIFALLLNVAQALNFAGVLGDSVFVGPIEVRFTAMRYGFIPRFGGTAWDQNRGAMLTIAFAVLVSLPRPALPGRRGWLVLAGVMAALSLSRSAALAAIPALLLTPRIRGGQRSLQLGVATALAVVAIASLLQLDPSRRERTVEAVAPLAERFSPQEGSAQAHAALLGRAVEVATRDLRTLFGGIGYGMSHRVLADLQGGNRYANFHSTWMAFLVELGVLALITFGLLTFAPLRRGGPLVGLVVGIAIFNIFYTFDNDAMLWLTVTLAWLIPRPQAA